MGRSRGNFHSTDEDPTQRTRRKKNAASGESSESGAAGQGTGEGKGALYHCNYCNKDITGKIRIKCFVCPDFDLCVECFSVGAELTPHKSNHPYRVMDNLTFPLFCPDWNADEEILLLEGIEMYGLGNWAEIAEHVGTKNKENCINHYTNVYMNSPLFPLPDMSHVVGKNREELLAMAKGHSEDNKGFSIGELSLKEESPFSPSRIKIEDSRKDAESGMRSSGSAVGTNMAQMKGGPGVVKVEDPQDRDFKGKKPISGNEDPSLLELSGYNPKRQEFDIEYDNDAEQLLADMEFKETDTEDEHELKLRVLRIYSKKLDERQRRKDFILQRNLLYPSAFEKSLSVEEKAICRRFDVFMRHHSKEEHEELLKSIVEEHRILKRLEALKEARDAGCRTSAEAEIYIEQKRKREAEANARRGNQSGHVPPSSQGGSNVFMASNSIGKDRNSRSSAGDPVNSGAELLSEAEKRLCNEIRVAPRYYLKMQEIMSLQIFIGNITKKSDAYRMFKLEPAQIDEVYDMLVKKGIAHP
ncbi:hypothetical protein UlMin_016601 [Ulmus minor]